MGNDFHIHGNNTKLLLGPMQMGKSSFLVAHLQLNASHRQTL